MLKKAILCAAVLVALLAPVAQATVGKGLGKGLIIINGGAYCKPVTPRQIVNQILTQDPTATVAFINAAIAELATYNFELCTNCVDPSHIAVGSAIFPGKVMCQCAPGYGWSQTITTIRGKNGPTNFYKNKYGCSKCPPGTTSNNNNQGPFRPGSNRPGTSSPFTNTPCV